MYYASYMITQEQTQTRKHTFPTVNGHCLNAFQQQVLMYGINIGFLEGEYQYRRWCFLQAVEHSDDLSFLFHVDHLLHNVHASRTGATNVYSYWLHQCTFGEILYLLWHSG